MCIFLICLNNNNIFIAIVLYLLLPSCFAVVFQFQFSVFPVAFLSFIYFVLMLKLPAKRGKWARRREREVGDGGRRGVSCSCGMVRQINMQRAASFSQLVELAQKSW